MSKTSTYLYICDLCGLEKRTGENWYQNANGGHFTVKIDGINGGYSWENLCPECREYLVKGVELLLNKKLKVRRNQNDE
jgi:hypothetical protein